MPAVMPPWELVVLSSHSYESCPLSPSAALPLVTVFLLALSHSIIDSWAHGPWVIQLCSLAPIHSAQYLLSGWMKDCSCLLRGKLWPFSHTKRVSTPYPLFTVTGSFLPGGPATVPLPQLESSPPRPLPPAAAPPSVWAVRESSVCFFFSTKLAGIYGSERSDEI